VQNAQASRFKLEFSFVPKRRVFVVTKRVGIFAHVIVEAAHALDLAVRHTRAHQQRAMLSILKPAVKMARLPVVNKHFRVFCFIAQRLRETAMIFVCVSEHDATQIRNAKACLTQTCPERFNRFFRLRPGVDDRQRIFSDQIDVYRANVERRGQ
jgi:hypothetical protein